jgi:hypothetical protein
MLAQRIPLIVSTLTLWAYSLSIAPAESQPSATADPPQAMNFTLEGRINRLEPNKFTVSTEENIVFHVRYDEKTEIKRQDGSAGSAKDLRVGLRVKVDGDLTESGEIVAHQIEIQPEPGAKRTPCFPSHPS